MKTFKKACERYQNLFKEEKTDNMVVNGSEIFQKMLVKYRKKYYNIRKETPYYNYKKLFSV